ncbi:hypothetical protein Godav_019766, partial [Gossypium davidsonii]|nr:hypothetical protein [Gossypium davidsonii]
TLQPRVSPEEAGVTVAAESSIGTWTAVSTDGLTNLDSYKGRWYHIEPIPEKQDQYVCYVDYPLDIFEKGSVINMFTSIVPADKAEIGHSVAMAFSSIRLKLHADLRPTWQA